MVLDTELANTAIYRLLENGNVDANVTGPSPLLTDMYTVAEIINAINQRQQKFLLDTGMIVTRTVIPANQGQSVYDLPADNILPRRLTWMGGQVTSTPPSYGYGTNPGGYGGNGYGGTP